MLRFGPVGLSAVDALDALEEERHVHWMMIRQTSASELLRFHILIEVEPGTNLQTGD